MKAEKQALEECLSATASAQRHTPPSAQPAPVTPQPHRSSNPSSAKLSEGIASRYQRSAAPDSHDGRPETRIHSSSYSQCMRLSDTPHNSRMLCS